MPNKPAAVDSPFKGIKTGRWSKYGGARRGLEHSKSDPTWCCQICGEEQPMSLPGFFIKHPTGEYLKICAKCFSKARTLSYSWRRTTLIIKTCKPNLS